MIGSQGGDGIGRHRYRGSTGVAGQEGHGWGLGQGSETGATGAQGFDRGTFGRGEYVG